jgi:hypothetical protein
MKGLVFVEFVEFVEDRFSLETVDRIIEKSSLATGGAYTSVGVYDYREMIQLVSQLSSETGVEARELLRVFGQHTFGRFVDKFPELFAGVESAIEFLGSIEGHIHVEVKKLYPDAELPTFHYEPSAPGSLVMVYESPRCLADFAMGLITGAVEHFGTPMEIDMAPLTDDHSRVRFTVSPRADS